MNDGTSEQLTFEQALADLERVVQDLEEGKIGLEESLTLYEKGVALVRRCQNQLSKAELRIQELLGCDAEGQALTRAFGHRSSLEKETRSREPGVKKKEPAQEPKTKKQEPCSAESWLLPPDAPERKD